MSNRKVLKVLSEDQNSRKWSVPLCKDVFISFIAQGGDIVQRIFAEGSVFSPFLFETFFDPADAFPLWEFESEILLTGLRNPSKRSISWSETEEEYNLKAELPDARNVEVVICGEKRKVLEISGSCKGEETTKSRDWREGCWWEHGFVRRLEMPEDAKWRKTEAYIINDTILEIKVPKITSNLKALSDE